MSKPNTSLTNLITPPVGTLVGTVTDGSGMVVNVYATEVSGGVKFDLKVVSGYADLRGFFLDVGDSTSGVSVVADGKSIIGNEQVTSVGKSDNNISGTGENFDLGIEIGTAGIGKDDISQTSFTVKGITLASLDDMAFGIRATSVGDSKADRSDSVKLVGHLDTVTDNPTPEGHFPAFQGEVTNVILYYNTDNGDLNDGFYTLSFDVPVSFDNDPDAWLDSVVNQAKLFNPDLDGVSVLGVGVKTSNLLEGGYYELDSNPHDVDLPPTGFLVNKPDVEIQYNYDTLFGVA